MAYTLKLSNGQLLVNLPDQQSDKVTTSLTLIGKNVNAYGTDINQNYIRILENFANSTPPPANNLVGQLWYDSAKQQLKVFTASNQYKPVGTPIISATRPVTLSAGDLWYDTTTQQLKFLESSNNLVIIGPATDVTVGKSGWVTEVYNTLTNQTAEGLYSNGKLLGILSDVAFDVSSTLTNLTQVGIGLTANTSDGLPFEFFGTATYATALIKDTFGVKSIVTASQFISTDDPIVTNYPVSIRSSATNALEVGLFQDIVLYQQGFIEGITLAAQVTATIAINNTDEDFELTIASGSDPFKAPPIHIDSNNAYIGIFNRTPTTDLDIIGDVKITGDLIVTGATTEITTERIQLTDKILTLAFDPTGDLNAAQRDNNANGGGIVVNAGIPKELKWYDTSPDTGARNIWSLTDDLELRYSTSTYRIANQIVLSQTALGPSVVSAPGLTEIGELSSATIANIRFTSSGTTSTITCTPGGRVLVIGSGDTLRVEFGLKKLVNVATPVIGDSASTVATKGYVDSMIDVSRNVKAGITIDVTGSYTYERGTIDERVEPIATTPIDPNLDQFVIEMLGKIYDPSLPIPYDTPNGTIAKVMVVRYSTPSTTVVSNPIDLGLPVDVLNIDGNPETVINYNQNLVARATFDLDANTPLTVNRAIKQYIVSPSTGFWTSLDYPIGSGSGTNVIWDDGTW
jgi:hypothetical protein